MRGGTLQPGPGAVIVIVAGGRARRPEGACAFHPGIVIAASRGSLAHGGEMIGGVAEFLEAVIRKPGDPVRLAGVDAFKALPCQHERALVLPGIEKLRPDAQAQGRQVFPVQQLLRAAILQNAQGGGGRAVAQMGQHRVHHAVDRRAVAAPIGAGKPQPADIGGPRQAERRQFRADEAGHAVRACRCRRLRWLAAHSQPVDRRRIGMIAIVVQPRGEFLEGGLVEGLVRQPCGEHRTHQPAILNPGQRRIGSSPVARRSTGEGLPVLGSILR